MSDADDMIDQLNSLCEDFGCPPGTERIEWLRIQLAHRAKVRSEAFSEAIKIAEDMWGDGPEYEHDGGAAKDGWNQAVSKLKHSILSKAKPSQGDEK